MNFINTRAKVSKKNSSYHLKSTINYLILSLGLLISFPLSAQNQLKENSNLQKKAQEYFNSKDYQNALENYNLLLKTYPKDPELNYYSGICLTELEQNLNTAIYQLKLASLSPVPADVYFYLGKANYQLNHFDEALAYFERFKKTGSREDQKNLKADQWIAWSESNISNSKLYPPENVGTPGSHSAISDYNIYLGRAISDQKKSDSLKTIVFQLREELSVTNEIDHRESIKLLIRDLNKESDALQLSANEYFEKANQIENSGALNNKEIINSGPIIEYYRPTVSRIPKNIPGRSSNVYIEQVSDAFYEQPQIKKILNPDDVSALSEMDHLNKTYNKSMQQSWELDNELEKQKVVVSAAKSQAESKRALRKIKSLEKQSSQKKLQAFIGYQEVNSGKYAVYKSNIDRILKDKNNKNYKEIQRHTLNSEENYKNSVKLKEEAEMVTDWEEEFDLYGESNAYELLALENQKKAIAVYAGILNPDRIDESVDQASIPPQKKEPQQIPKDDPDPLPIPMEEEKEPISNVVIVKFPTRNESLIVEEKSIPELTREIEIPEVVSKTSTQKINDFSILPTPDYNKMIPIPLDRTLPDGVAYKIQVGVFKNLRTQSYFRGLQPITAESIEDKDLIRYFAGLFSNYEDARNALRKVRKNEFKDAFIVAYYKGQKISTDRAKLLEKEGKGSIPENIKMEQHNVYFKIQIGVFSKEVGPDLYRTFKSHAGDKKLEYFVNKNGNVVYTIGKFLTFDSAGSFNKELKTKGLSDAFVIAFDENKKISIREAQILLNEK